MKRDPLLEILDYMIELEGRRVLADHHRAELRRFVLDDPEFVEAVEAIAAAALKPRPYTYTKENVRRELEPAINAARRLDEIIGVPGATIRMPYYARHAQFVVNLKSFIKDMEARLAAHDASPDRAKPKDARARDVVRQLADLFHARGLSTSTSDPGPFFLTVQTVFDAVNAVKDKSLPASAQRPVRDVLLQNKIENK